MRMFLLPISTRRTLIYCEPLALSSTVTKPSILDRVVVKANTTWAEWEKDTQSIWNWKKRTTNYGNMVFRRISYEEWGLKSIQPARRKPPRSQGSEEEKPLVEQKVELHFPSLYQGLCRDSVFESVKRLATERQGLHRKRMWYSILAMPLTIPVGLLPIIPNLPFFYLVFRAYSHWRALNGSNYLSHMLSRDLLQPTPSSTLDNLYTAGLLYPTRAASRNAPEPTMNQTRAVVECLRQQTSPGTIDANEKPPSTSPSTTPSPVPSSSSQPSKSSRDLLPGKGKRLHTGEEEVMLLQVWNGKLLAERLKLPELEVEIERAVEQVQDSIQKDEGELLGEKKELEELTEQFRSQGKSTKAEV